MVSFVKYVPTDVPIGECTNRTEIDHHDTPPEREGRIQWNWVGGDDLEDDHHYHKDMTQDVHFAP